MADDIPLHRIEPIVTPDRFELGAHRMRVPGGWLYWVQVAPGCPVAAFVPDQPGVVPAGPPGDPQSD